MADGKYIRVKAHTMRAINKAVGEAQRETGDNLSADSVLWMMIERLYPEIAAEERPLANGLDPYVANGETPRAAHDQGGPS